MGPLGSNWQINVSEYSDIVIMIFERLLARP